MPAASLHKSVKIAWLIQWPCHLPHETQTKSPVYRTISKSRGQFHC